MFGDFQAFSNPLVIVPASRVERAVRPGRLKAGTYSHHPQKERKII